MQIDKEIDVLKCIANETRYKILKLLEEKERSVNEIIEALDEEQSLISHHLQGIRKCGLVKKRREGRKIIYSLANPEISDFLEEIKELSNRYCRIDEEN
ncbi:MAG: metalloregulator ArsR/SmtB family transcription factor [Candidatus Thermoplasmatota archaeon]